MNCSAANGPGLVCCPMPAAQTARAVAATMLDEGLAPCANILGRVPSLLAWNGGRDEAEGTGVLFKTDAALFDRAIARLPELRP